MIDCRVQIKPLGSASKRNVGAPAQARICSMAADGGVAAPRQILGFVTTLKNS